jgi:two-component system sensor histidine kinase YesM
MIVKETCMNLLAHLKKLVAGVISLRGSIKLRLITAFIALSMIPVFIIAVFSSMVYIRTFEDKIGDYSSQLIVQTTGKLDVLFENIENLSLQIVTSTEIQSLMESLVRQGGSEKQTDQIESIIGNIITSRNEITGVNILLNNDKGMIVSGEKLVEEDDFYKSGEYGYLKNADGQPVWKSTYYNSDPLATYSYVATCLRKIKSVQTGQLLGYLVIGVKEFALADMYSYLDLGPDGEVFITDNRGNYVSNLNKNLLAQPSGYPFAADILKRGDTVNDTIFYEYNGEKLIISYDVSAVTGWYIFCVVDYRYVMDAVITNLQFTVIVVIAIIVISVVLSLFISLSISNPVEELTKAMKRVEDGDLNVKVSYRAKNEIGKLYSSFNKMIANINELIHKVYQTEILKQKAEINALQSQINPHFLYNTLAMIDGIAMMRGEKDISKIAETLGEMFRYSLSGWNFATLREEIDQAANYLVIQKYFKKDNLEYFIEVDPDLENCYISKLLLQPLLENAIIHGAERTLKKCVIRIEARKDQQGNMVIAVSDNGKGIDEDSLAGIVNKMKSTKNIFTHSKNAKRYHIGLGNIYWRIKNLYGDEYGLYLKSRIEEGATVTMVLPMIDKMPGEGASDE